MGVVAVHSSTRLCWEQSWPTSFVPPSRYTMAADQQALLPFAEICSGAAPHYQVTVGVRIQTEGARDEDLPDLVVTEVDAEVTMFHYAEVSQ